MLDALFLKSFENDLKRFFEEDDLSRNSYYIATLPKEEVTATLKIKSPLILSGLPFFVASFNFLGADLKYSDFESFEGRRFKPGDEIKFKLPFAIALTGERVALNLLQRSTSVSTYTSQFVEAAGSKRLNILDTRKTTPGLRSVEKYAVRLGGATNHRFGQADAWMIKDNHKSFFGSLEAAWAHFKSMQSFYAPIVVEIHSMDEFKKAIELGITTVMLDNFSPEQIAEAVKLKPMGMTIEISGGLKLDTIKNYLIDGVDALSIGSLTHSAPHVDISLKFKR